MFRPRLRGRGMWFVGLAVPLLLWALVVALTPTGWIKNRLVARLRAETGRSVRIESVCLGFSGNLKIAGLSLAEWRTPADPWLKIRQISINVHPVQVLLGCCRPGDMVIDGAEVRVWRREDGRFEFGDLTKVCTPPGLTVEHASSPPQLVPAINLVVANSSIRLVDDYDDLRITLRGVTGRGSFKPLAVQLDELSGQVNGGTFKLAARLARDPSCPRFSAEVQAKKVRLDQSLNLVETFVPLVARSDSALSGLLNFHLAVKGQGASSAEIRRSLVGHGSLLLDPIHLDGSRILSELQVLGGWPEENHVGAVSSNFTVALGRVNTDDLTIRASKLPFVVAGWTDFDGRFDYAAQVDRMLANLPREAQAILGDLKTNLRELAGLRIEGDQTEAHLTLNGHPLATDLDRNDGERAKFRAAARKVRDRFFR